MSSSPRPARYGPFHRRTGHDPSENEKVATSGEVWGKPRGHVYSGLFPSVKAWDGPLPEGIIGFEFFTDVEPYSGSTPA